ncbi:MAG: DUF1071 domain-containing protein [Clostridia bacterium]|nr:DUF1071 domain-containing protein [Clostridia bacterium]
MKKETKQEKSIFETLFNINVGEHIEKKNGLSYLSWPFAWSEVKKIFPDANYKVKLFGENNLPYVYDESTGYMVFTSVTINDLTHEMWLPVMDNSNKSMKSVKYTYDTNYRKNVPVEPASMFDINKAIMRCLVKNLSMFGLGLYIYAGEDLPEKDSEKILPSDVKSLKKIISEFENSEKLQSNILKNYGVKNMEELNTKQFAEILEKLNNWKNKE